MHCEGSILKCIRLGKEREPGDRPRPMKIEFCDQNTKHAVLRAKNKLSQSEHFKSIYISPELTDDQRKSEFEMRKECRDRNQKGEKVVIYRHKIVTAEEREELVKQGPKNWRTHPAQMRKQ